MRVAPSGSSGPGASCWAWRILPIPVGANGCEKRVSGFAGYAGYLLLPERLAPSPMWRKVGYGSVELVDATHLKCVGLHGKVWRIHCLSSLLTQQVRQVIGTRAKVAENLQ